MEINIANLTKSPVPTSDYWENIAKETFDFVGFKSSKNIEVNLVFVSQARIRDLNKEWRKNDKATDVLSFSSIDTPQGKLAQKLKLKNLLEKRGLIKKSSKKLGIYFDNDNQIVICLSYADKQAKKLKLSLGQNLARLFSHGILHILGYDHERSEEETEVMDKLQVAMIKKFK